jgi:hypothetical protein
MNIIKSCMYLILQMQQNPCLPAGRRYQFCHQEITNPCSSFIYKGL